MMACPVILRGVNGVYMFHADHNHDLSVTVSLYWIHLYGLCILNQIATVMRD